MRQRNDNWVPIIWEWLVEHMDRGAILKRCWVRKLFNRNKASIPGFSGGGRSLGPPPLDFAGRQAATFFRHALRIASPPWEARHQQS
jgi:hypothetical protein